MKSLVAVFQSEGLGGPWESASRGPFSFSPAGAEGDA
jgi:hypothetical protein